MRQAWRRARVLVPDGNVLRRRWDAIESAIAAGLIAVFLIASPLAAIGAARLVGRDVLRQARIERSWRQVTATLAHRRAGPPSGSADVRVGQSARARWTAGGQSRAGWVPVSPAAAKSGKVTVWVDADGGLTGAPPALPSLGLEEWLSAASAVLGVAIILVMAGAGAHRLLDRRRMAGWERAWEVAGPDWCRRR
jgi:hypothetical protein